jgi:RNA polymerase sigma-70 factor (ECF subfamily)
MPEESDDKSWMCGVDDRGLAGLAAAGDGDAFEHLFRRHWRSVYALCLRMTANPQDAEDLTQETFLQLYKSLSSFNGGSKFSTWLHRVAVNQVLMEMRRRAGGRGVLQLGGCQITDRAGEAPRHLDRLSIERALPLLPPGYRMVFVLHDIEGFRHDEIGELLGCAVGTSKSQLHKARLRLRKIIKGEARHGGQDEAEAEEGEARAEGARDATPQRAIQVRA